MRRLILGFSLILALINISFAQSEDCNTATSLGAADLNSGNLVSGTTADNTASGFWGGAPQMTASCDNPTTLTIDEWYRIDLVNENDITIDLVGAGHIAVIIEASLANCGTPNMNTFLACHDPNIMNPQTFENCFTQSTTYYIVILTDAANQGAYDLTVTAGLSGGQPSLALGDNCANAVSLDPGTDGTVITCANNITGTTLNNFQELKGDMVADGVCIFDNEATMWYSFTAGDDLYVENTTGTGLSVALYSGACGGLTLVQCDNNGNLMLEDMLIAGQTYYLQVAYPYGSDGSFNICVNSPLPPLVGDDCSIPEALGTLVDGVGTSITQVDNFGASSTSESFTPGLIAGCGSGSYSTVYYEFTIGGTGNTNVNLNYNEGTISTSQVTILTACTDATAFNGYEYNGNTNEDFCLMPGTYLIQVASCDAFEGNYSMTLTASTPPTNDGCMNADLFNDPISSAPTVIIPPNCTTFSVSGTTENACPEAAAIGTCAFDTEATVWYTFTTNTVTTQEAEVNLTSISMGAGMFAIIEGSCTGSIVNSCQTDGIEANITLLPNTQYYIAVAPQTNQMSGTFNLDIELTSAPTNDDCDLGTNPDITATTMGSTTCADGEVIFCGMTTTNDHQVFYQYTNSTGVNIDLEVTFSADATNGTPAANVSMLVITDCNAFTLFNGTTASDYCNVLGTANMIDCIENGETIIIVVGSSDGDEGDFNILTNVINTQPTDDNDECSNALLIWDGDNVPADNTCSWKTINGSTAEACPEDFNLVGCNYDDDPTVWYSFTAPISTNSLSVEMQNLSGIGALYATIFEMTLDCDVQTVLPTAMCNSGVGPFGPYDIVSGTTYLIAVADPGGEGVHSFDIKINESPINNDCDSATNPDIFTTATGSTNCATGNFDFCGQTIANDHQVFYEYTNNTVANVDLEITFAGDASNGSAATGLSMVVFTDDCNAMTIFEGTTVADYCNILGNMASINCIEQGVTIIIMVGSAVTEEGDFTIITNENTTQPNDNNDECTDALSIWDPALDNTCEWKTINGNTANACPEDFTFNSCTLEQIPVVWYSFTAPTTTNPITVEIQNTNGTGTVSTMIMESTADCDNPVALAGFTCAFGTGPYGPTDIMSGQTYLIAIGDDIEGPHSFEIKINELPANDECVDGVILNNGVSTMGTTTCATQEIIPFDSNVCTNQDEENTVWYEFTVPDGVNGFDLTVTSTATNGFMGDVNIVVFESTAAGCIADNSTFEEEACSTSGTLVEDFECIGPGTYVIRISTSEANAGEFDILAAEYTSPVANDMCSNPTVITIDPVCIWYPVDATTVDACPEQFDFASDCGFDDFPVVWYEIDVTDDNATEIQINLISSASGNAFYSIFAGNPIDCNDLIPSSISGVCETALGNNGTIIDILANGPMTYLIGVGADDINGSNSIQFEIKVLVAPSNDECVDGVILNNGVSTMGTTTCATQAIIPFDSNVCNDVDEENTVWYEFTVPDGVNGFDLTVTSTATNGFMGDVNIVVFESTAAGCIADNSTFEEEACSTSGTLVEDFECIGPGTYVIRISTSDFNSGGFDILATEYTSPVANDMCSNPTVIVVDPTCVWYPVDASTIDACPEQFDFASDCGFDDFPVVWYEIDVTNDDASEIQINLISSATGNGFYSVFAGNPADCSDLVPTSISGACEISVGNNVTDIDILANPPMTYLIGIGADNINGSASIMFEIKVLVPPMNDDPCTAEEITTAGDVNTVVSGTTTCATMDVDDTTCGTQDENSVWYEYTIPAGTTGFIATLTSTGTGQDFAVGVFENTACGGGNVTFLDADQLTECGAEGGVEMKFDCLEENTMAFIMVSTNDAEAGDFDLTIDPIVPDPLCVDNDLCSDADDTAPTATPITDGGQVCVTDCNIDACPENFFAAVCAYNDLPTVFYEITTDALAEDATMSVILSSADGNPIFSVFQAGCAEPPTAETAESLCVEGDGSAANLTGMEVNANTTYIIAVALDNVDQIGGDFDLCVNVVTSCNDDPCSPYPLVNGDGVGSIALDCDNNVAATPETWNYVTGDCSDADMFNSTVYFSYTVPDGVGSFTVFYTNDPTMGIQNGVVLTVLEYDAANCSQVQVIMAGQECGQPSNIEPIEVDCPPAGNTYLIQVSSAEGDEGEFDILITETLQTDPCSVNDDCGFATVLDVSETCKWLDFSDCNVQACPEEFADPGDMCAFDKSAVVWFTFTTPANASTVSIEIEPDNGSPEPIIDPTWGLFIDDGCPDLPTAVNNDVICVTTEGGTSAIEEDINIQDNTTYYIAVGSETDIEGGFILNIKIEVPPINDDPCDTDDNPPFDLTGGGSHQGTTCCARGPKDENEDGSLADLENVDCSAATEDAAVWYTYTPNEDDDGYQIFLEEVGGPDGIGGNVTVEIYWGTPNQGCSGFGETIASSCTDTNLDIKIGNCSDPGQILFVKVTTDDADDECGEFILTINPATCGDMSDECIDTADAAPIEPETPETFDIIYTCVTSCIDFGCPEDDNFGGCPDMINMPTVWFQVNTDDEAAQLFTTVETEGNWTPIWSVYGGDDCSSLEVMAFGGAPPCSNGDNTPELHQTPVQDAFSTYWVAVTVDPASLPQDGNIDDGTFKICVASVINAVICLGDESDCTDPSLVMEVIERENEGALEGPFCAGEEVTINISFFYDATLTGQDWLIGIVPKFGPGWDLENFDYVANAPTGTPAGVATWFEEGGACAPILQEPLPHMCTYIDNNGVLRLCNLLCENCSECDQQFMVEGDILPSGYFWISNGGNAGCDNDCSPGEAWGIGSTMSQIDWEFTLIVKTFDSYEDCIDNRDLQISFQTFSDGVGGCWEDPVGECLIDKAMVSYPWLVECEAPPAVEGEDEEICFNGTTNIFVSTVDGSTNTIIVEVEDNPNVSGEMTYIFENGTGTIEDDLTNLTNDIQMVTYTVYSEDETLPCPGPQNEIIVTIYPELMATFPPDVYICDGFCTDITPDVIGGFGMPYSYEWSTGETTASINVCPLVPTTYFVTVTDDLGCEDIAEVQVDVKPPVIIELPDEIEVCKDDNFFPFDPDYFVTIDYLSGSAPYNVVWNSSPIGLVGEVGGFGETYIINEQASSEFNSPYELCAEVTDFFGCTETVCVTVNITGELLLNVSVFDIECGDTEALINIVGFDALGNPLTDFVLYGGCPQEDYLEDGFSNSGTFTFPAVDLLSYTCYTIVASTPAGCSSSIEIDIPLTTGTPIEIAGTENICIGDEATITVTNAGDFDTFVWTPDIGSTGSVIFSPDSTATYQVEATDLTGCTSIEIFTVNVNTPPELDMAGSTVFCAGSSATLTGSGGVSYVWTSTSPEFPITGPEITVSTEITVTLTITDINGCTNDSTVTFIQDDNIPINLGDVNICDGIGETIEVNGDFINFEWSDGTTVLSTTNTFTISGPGTFTVSAIDIVSGCDAFGSFEVMDFATPIITVTDTVNVCREDSGVDSLCVNFNNQVSGSNGTWSQVSAIPGFVFSDFGLDNVCFEGIQTGYYVFEFTTNDAEQPCMDVSKVMVVNVVACPCPSPATSLVPDMCNDDDYDLNLSVLTGDPGSWSVISGPVAQDINGLITGSIFDANGIVGGVYTVRFTLDNSGGPACEEYSEQMFTVFEVPTVSVVGDGDLCNIEGQTSPTSMDLFDLISNSVSDGGTWAQLTGTNINITGGSMISSSSLTDFPETFTFEYTSEAPVGSPCPPAVVEVTVVVRDCNCPLIAVLTDTLCNNGLPIDLNDLLVNPEGLLGSWSVASGLTLMGTSMVDPADIPSGLYDITWTLNNSAGPTCELAYINSLLIRKQPVIIPITGPTPCSMDTGNGSTVSNLYDWLDSESSLGTWTQTGGTPTLPIDEVSAGISNVDFDGQPVGSMFTFTFNTNVAVEPCTDISTVITITVGDCNCPPIMLVPPADVCNDSDSFELEILADGSDPGTFEVFTSGGTDISDRITGNTFDAIDLNAGTYTIVYTLDQVVTGTCTQSLSVMFNVSNYQLTDGIDEVEVCNDDSGNGVTMVNFTTLVDNAGAGVWSEVTSSGVPIGTLIEQQNASFVNVPVGIYTFLYTIDNADPCEDFVHTVTVTVIDECNCPPINPLDPDDVCNTDGPVDLAQYDDINNPGTWSSTELTISGSMLDIDGVVAGSYDLTYTITSPLPDCPETEVVSILIGEPANSGIAEDYRLCAGLAEVIDLNAQLSGQDAGGTWVETTGSTGFDDANATFNTDGQSEGTYSFDYKIDNNAPCPDVQTTVTVILDPNPTADAGDTKMLDCDVTSAQLGDSGTSTGDDISYSWVNTNTGTEVGTDINFTAMNEGIYELTVINSATGCTDVDQVEVITSDDLPQMDVNPTDISCNGFDDGGVELINQFGGDGSYTYSLNGGAPVTDPSTWNTLPANDYTVTIMDGNGCIQEYEFSITEPAAIYVDAGADIVGDLGETFTLSIDYDSTLVTNIVWTDFEDNTDTICQGLQCGSIEVTPSQNVTTYYVQVTNENGCEAHDEIQIQLEQIVDVAFPNIISPNGDGDNDVFYIKSDDVESVLSLKIFDRWGEKLFDIENAPPRDPSVGWDGMFKETLVVSGVYVFYTELLFIDGTVKEFSGDITVIDTE